MIGPPPGSTLFPSPTLSGSVAEGREAPRGVPAGIVRVVGEREAAEPVGQHDRRGRRRDAVRSEDHTSELQSRQYLVCRLLLEKKQPPSSRAAAATLAAAGRP